MQITGRAHFVSLVRSFRETGNHPDSDTLRDLKAFIDRVPFYHRIELLKGLLTPGFMTHEHSVVLKTLDRCITPGSRVLDVGCRDGLFSLKAQEKGASEIVAVDIDHSEGFKEIVGPIFNWKNIRYLIGNFLDPALDMGSEYDFIVFSGILYHLRYPFVGLRKVADLLKTGGFVILETAYLEEFPDLPMLCCPVGDFSPFEPTSVTFFNRRGLSDSLGSFGLKVTEVVTEFTFPLNSDTRFKELPFPSMAEPTRRDVAAAEPGAAPEKKQMHNVGRLVWICQKVGHPAVPWTHSMLTPQLVHSYWNLTATTHKKPTWLDEPGVKPAGDEK